MRVFESVTEAACLWSLDDIERSPTCCWRARRPGARRAMGGLMAQLTDDCFALGSAPPIQDGADDLSGAGSERNVGRADGWPQT
jgi:hypothetical protein